MPVFDVAQTEGEPLPELDTAATGDADDLWPALRSVAPQVEGTVEVFGDGGCRMATRTESAHLR